MNFLKSIKGSIFSDGKKERILLKSKGVDLEQFSPSDLHDFGNRLKTDLNHLKAGEYIKVYGLDSGVYVDSPKAGILSTLRLKHCNEGLVPFFGSKEFYSDPDFTKGDCVKVNSIYSRFISISPEENAPVDFGSLAKEGNIVVSFRKINTRTSKTLVDDSRKINHAALYKMLSDIEGIEAYRENEEVLWKIVNREEELFRVRILFVVQSVSEEDLFDKTEALVESLSIKSLGPKIVNYSLNNDFYSYTPGLVGDLEEGIILRTSVLVNCLPIHADVIHNEGLELRAASGSSVKINTMKGDNYSLMITGKSGSGKTFLCQKILTYELEQGRAVFMIDPKRDYEKFALLNNFRIIDKDVNPMIFKEDLYFRDIVLSRIPESERSARKEGLLLRVIRETGAWKLDSFFDALKLLEDNGFENISLYFEDMKGKISTKKEEPTDRVYILSSSFTDNTLSFILTYAFQYLKRIGKPYKFVIDEAHRVFASNPTFLEQRVREVRVANSGLVTLTQSYDVLTSNRFGEIVAGNSDHKFFFRQPIKEGAAELENHEIQRIGETKKLDGYYSSCYYKSSTHRKIVYLHPSKKEFEVFRSGEEEREKLLKYIQERLSYLTVDQAINNYVWEVNNESF